MGFSKEEKDNSGKYVDYQWIYVDLQNYYDISKIVLNWEAACAKSYKLQISSNGKTEGYYFSKRWKRWKKRI